MPIPRDTKVKILFCLCVVSIITVRAIVEEFSHE